MTGAHDMRVAWPQPQEWDIECAVCVCECVA